MRRVQCAEENRSFLKRLGDVQRVLQEKGEDRYQWSQFELPDSRCAQPTPLEARNWTWRLHRNDWKEAVARIDGG